jgi:hypothetical protein
MGADQSRSNTLSKGHIDGVLDTGQGLVTFRIKTPQQVAAAVNAKLLDGQLDHLSIDARVHLGVLLGPESAPGEQLAHRIEAEGRWSHYRQFASGVIDLAAVSIASGGAGGLIEGAAVGARLRATGIRAARFVAASASFTTLMGLSPGNSRPAATPKML